MIGLLEDFYANQLEQITPTRLLVKRLQPGTYRIEPGFSLIAKKLPATLQQLYLVRGQAEMQTFAAYLKKSWQQQSDLAVTGVKAS